MIQYIIACDLGGTKCAAGLIEYNQQTKELSCSKDCSIKLKDTHSLDELIHVIEHTLGITFATADAICIGGAGQYNGESLIYAGTYPYPMHFAALAKAQDWAPFAVIHDYAPIICATFTSYMQQPNNVQWIHRAEMNTYGRRVAVGLGTGLGMKDGVLLESGDFWLGKNEIGHIGITLPPTASTNKIRLHNELMHYLQQHAVPVTFEKILSGPGTQYLYEFFYPNQTKITSEEIGKKMREGHAPEMNNAFSWYLGLLIGTLQLAFMPDGGIWITGGVALNHLDIFACPDFFAGVTASPAYAEQRAHYPLGILCNTQHALLGGGFYAVKRLL